MHSMKELKIGFGIERMPCRLQTLWPGKRQRRLLPDGRHCPQSLRALQALRSGGWLAAASYRHGALAVISSTGSGLRHAGAWVLKVAATFERSFLSPTVLLNASGTGGLRLHCAFVPA